MAGLDHWWVVWVHFAGSLLSLPSLVCLSPFFSREVFPQGLPDEYAFVTTFRFRRTSRKEDWYIWQVIDQYGIPQVRTAPPYLSGPELSVFLAQGLASPTVFSPGLLSLGLERSRTWCMEAQRTCKGDVMRPKRSSFLS